MTVIAATGPYTDRLHWPQNQLGVSIYPRLTVLSPYFRLINNRKYGDKTVKFTHLSLISHPQSYAACCDVTADQ